MFTFKNLEEVWKTSKNFLLKNIYKVALQHLFNFFVLFNTIFYLELNFKLKIDPKTCNLKNLEEILKIWRKFAKIFGNPV